MKKRAVFCVILILLAVSAVFAQRGGRAQDVLEVRLGSPLPRNSDWGRTLDRIAGEWSRVTDGQVRLRVIHDGLEGSDAKMLSSLRSNSIQAALLTSTALTTITPSIMTLSIPFLIRDNAEFDLVLKQELPFLSEQAVKNNYVVMAWSKGGWVHVFTSEKVFTPDDLKRHRIGTSTEVKDMNTTFRTMGFNLIESDMVDMGTRLANNTINAIYFLPEAIAPMGIHRYLKNYLDMPIAPFIGAIVINRVTWNKLTPKQQQDLSRVTQTIATQFDATMERTAANAVASMQRDGLTVNQPTPAQKEMWRAEMNKAIPPLLGSIYDRDLYNRINKLLEDYRKNQ